MAPDPYQVLGVGRSATHDDIRKSFRRLAKKHHPDLNPGDKAAETAFKAASAAFDLLGDESRRRRYDAGEIDADGREVSRAYNGQPFGQAHGGDFDQIDLGEILGQMFGERRAGQGRRAGYPSRGRDIRARLEVGIREAIAGAKQRVVLADGKALDVTIPPGVVEGAVLRLKGQGEVGAAGAGDVLIEIEIAPHAMFQRSGNDLLIDLPVSVPDAVLGGKVLAPTPEGDVTLRIPKGSNSGAVLRLKGRGLPGAGGRRGDLLARVIVALPESSDGELENFCSDWRRERPYAPVLASRPNQP